MLCGKDVPLAQTLKNKKRGVVERTVDYDGRKDKYTVIYEGGVQDKIPAKNLREGEPLTFSRMERAFWIRKELQAKIKHIV